MSVVEQARRARDAAEVLATATRTAKDAALHAMADALVARTPEILAANATDLAAGRDAGLSAAVLDRLALDGGRVAAIADALREMAALPDPVGEVVRGSTLPNGLELRQVRVPFGVVGIVYEGRPNVTVDAAGICLKSGNAALLRGSSSAAHSNAALVEVLRDAVAGAGLPADAVQLLDSSSRDSVKELMRARGLVDVLIPRGGASLIRAVVEESTVPVIETGVGNLPRVRGRRRRPRQGAGGHVERQDAAAVHLQHGRVAAGPPRRRGRLPAGRAGRLRRGRRDRPRHPEVAAHSAGVVAATDEDFATEYLSADISVAVVDSLDDAVAHIRRYGTGHTEAIVTDSQRTAREFVARVDAAAVMVNASTRFTDGGEFGFGAEIGISTQKLHARGPMGLPELTSTKYVVTGDGHVR